MQKRGIINETAKCVLSAVFAVLLTMGCSSSPGRPAHNRLEQAQSPYLKEHADNPVDWYEWGDAALAKAKAENKPLLISIGYASCHWCHEMESESFMDTAVARIMNESFVCIKVDREERPDIDNIYMKACQLLNNGEGGWPLNAFALPDGKPFFAGTYYAKENWLSLLRQVADSYKYKNGKVQMQASSLTFGIVDSEKLFATDSLPKDAISRSSYTQLFPQLQSRLDFTNGGLRGQQKFPSAPVWDFLLQYHYLTGNKEALDASLLTLKKMALGGIYDQVEGGFSRYTTDSNWRVPHFEKMLYDNGQLASLYAHAYKLTGDDFYKTILTETLAFADAKLSDPAGGFYSSVNADTEEGEGAFYTWTAADFSKAIGSGDAALLADYFHVSGTGNWEKNKNILFATEPPALFAAARQKDPALFKTSLNKARTALAAARKKRKEPSVDNKVLTSWNAIMLKGYVDGYTATGEEALLKRALRAAAFLEKTMLQPDGKLMRNYKDGKTTVNGFLEDYAWTARAFVKVYEATFDKHWLHLSKKIADQAIQHFYDQPSGMFFYTDAVSSALVVRKMELDDQALPSSNAVMACALYELGILFSDKSYTAKAEQMLKQMQPKIKSAPAYYAQWCWLTGLKATGMYEVAIMGKEARKRNAELQKNYLPNCIFLGETREENLPVLEGKWQEDKTMIYVCTNAACKRPVEETGNALAQIKAMP